jgi:hypothetical protein
MGRGRFLALLASVIAALPLATSGQQIDKVWRIGYLAADPRHNDEVFRQALRELGYVEGRNLTILYRWGGSGDYEPLAQELVRQNVDLIVAVASLAAGAAGHATKTIPIVIYEVGDPVAYGFVLGSPRRQYHRDVVTALGHRAQGFAVHQGNHADGGEARHTRGCKQPRDRAHLSGYWCDCAEAGIQHSVLR